MVEIERYVSGQHVNYVLTANYYYAFQVFFFQYRYYFDYNIGVHYTLQLKNVQRQQFRATVRYPHDYSRIIINYSKHESSLCML